MTTVREASFELFRAHGMTTMFGNPGSTELPMLADWPADFDYVLGLQEAVVVGMADGYAQASGRPTLVNLHTAPGVGNAMGAIFNAQANHSPLVITAGQQVRPAITMQANLTNRDATRMAHPLVKWSYEPPRAEDVPHALARATHLATLPPKGPVLVSIPMDDWNVELEDDYARAAVERRTTGRAAGDPEAITDLARRLEAAANPVLIAGPDVDASGAWDAAVALAERQRLPVFAIPAPGGGRLGFPEGHPNFRGVLPPAIGPVSETLAGHDLVLVAGASVFAYYPYIPGPLLPDGADPRGDHLRSRRGGQGPDGRRDRRRRAAHPRAAGRDGRGFRSRPGRVAARPGRRARGGPDHRHRGDARARRRVPRRRDHRARGALGDARAAQPAPHLAAGSYYFGAGGGLGYGLSAAVGVQLAEPDRPVVCVVGEGSVQYAVTAFWSALAHQAPVTFLVLRNNEYAILKWFAGVEGVSGAPGLDLPGLDTAAIATGYGIGSIRVSTADELREALAGAIAAAAPGAGRGRRGARDVAVLDPARSEHWRESRA